MQVELSNDLFGAGGEARVLLLGVLAYGFSGRHRIVASEREVFNEWISRLDDSELQEELRLVLDDGEARSALGSPNWTLSVKTSRSLEDAFVLLGYPFRVLLENGRNDRDFLLAYADSPTRRTLEEAESKGWLLFETSGGIGEVVNRLKELAATPWAVERFFCLVDSDSKEPNAGSEEAVTVRENFTRIAAGLGREPDDFGHILGRRAAENYVNLDALKRWLSARLGGKEFDSLSARWQKALDRKSPSVANTKDGPYARALFATFALDGVSDVVWNCLDFSKGEGEKGDRTSQAVWAVLEPLQRSVLRFGFTKKLLREFFKDQTGLDDVTGELKPVLGVILERF